MPADVMLMVENKLNLSYTKLMCCTECFLCTYYDTAAKRVQSK